MRGIGTATLAVLALAASPGDAAAKCQESIGNPVLPGYVLIVDGKLKGEYAMDDQTAYPPSEEILRIEMACLRPAAAADPQARQAAVVIVTRRGAPQMLESYLADLVKAQAEYRSLNGEYARDLTDLAFLDSHISIPMEMDSGEAGWWAVATLPGSNSTCHVAVGSAARDPRFQRGPRVAAGTPVCSRS